MDYCIMALLSNNQRVPIPAPYPTVESSSIQAAKLPMALDRRQPMESLGAKACSSPDTLLWSGLKLSS